MNYHRAVVVIAALLVATSTGAQSTSALLPPQSKVDGKSQAQWSVSWWQWAGSFEYDDSPVADQTGASCQRKQKGGVWFLAGTYGSHRTIRQCSVPRGKYMFFPLINYVVAPCAGSDCPATPACKEFQDLARETTDNPSALILEIDGMRINGLERHRQSSPECFDLAAEADIGSKVYPTAADGYYVMLAPLPPGTHVINFGGVLPDLVQAVTYTIVVK